MKRRFSSLTDRTVSAGLKVLAEERRGARSYLPFVGPAIIASVAYMDPGNFATNLQAGAQFGYVLLWVVLLANLMAMLFQSLSAKLGLVTGKSLAELCRDHFSKPVVYGLWIGSELSAMATDVAEVLGGAVGLTLLFGLPLFVSCLIVGLVTYGILHLQNFGFRPMEIVIGAFVSAIGLSYLAELFIAPPKWSAVLAHIALPQLSGEGSLLLAVGIVGATIMPHALYLHSSLMKERIPAQSNAHKRRILRFSNHEVLVALGLAGLVNIAMVIMSAVVFHFGGFSGNIGIEVAYHTLTPLLGVGAAGIFMLSLLASGLSSSVVGTMAGQQIMQDFVPFHIPLFLRRLITLLPAFAVVLFGANTTQALILSQVILSLLLPIPLCALLWFTSRRDLMGAFANTKLTNVVAVCSALVVLGLNIFLIFQTLGLYI